MMHDSGCPGGHTADITCAEVAVLRAEAAANPWYCHGATRGGYHSFADHRPDAVCLYEGCNRTWGELVAARDATRREGD